MEGRSIGEGRVMQMRNRRRGAARRSGLRMQWWVSRQTWRHVMQGIVKGTQTSLAGSMTKAGKGSTDRTCTPCRGRKCTGEGWKRWSEGVKI